MKRIIVLGGTGFFGRLIVERLREAGLQPLAASRSHGDLRIDANNPEELRANLHQRELVIDAAGPFQKRSPALIDAAMRIGFDVVDLSDSPDYSAMVYERDAPIRASGIRVLPACSALSTVSALVLESTGIEQPQRLSAYLLPASHYTANAGAVESFLSSVQGRSRTFRFSDPFGDRSGVAVRSIDALTLPRTFPSLRTIELAVDTGMSSGNLLLRWRSFQHLIERFEPAVLKIARWIGETEGVLAYEIASTLRHKQQIFSGERSYMLAVLPAVHAAMAIASGRFPHTGVVAPRDHVDPAEFFEAVRREGIAITS
jgi:hypothetical protein